MASFSIIPLILYILFFSAVSINSYPLENICKQTKDPGFCYNLLSPYSSASLQEIEQRVVDVTLFNVKATGAKIKSNLSNIKDSNLVVIYNLCSNYYSAALSALNVAQEKMKSGQFRDLNSAATIVSEDASACQKTFSMAPSGNVPFANDNNNFVLLSNVFVVVSRIIST